MVSIADIEKETTEAIASNRRTLTEQTAKINSNADLSGAAKARYLEEANRWAGERHAEIVDAHHKAVADALEKIEKDLFRLTYPSSAITDSQKEAFQNAYRDAAFRLLGADEEIVSRAMSRALRTGDKVLAQAAYHEAVERGISEVANEYRQSNEKAAKTWETYASTRRASESRESILTGALLHTAVPQL
jgi:hypothetical protein